MIINTAVSHGAAWKQVTCGECSGPFQYHMERSASATVTDVFDPFETAKAELPREAHAELLRQFRESHDLVPCPKCGAYQFDMVSPSVPRPGLVTAGVVLVFLVGLAKLDQALPTVSIPAGPSLLGALVIGAVVYLPLKKLLEDRAVNSTLARWESINAHRPTNLAYAASLIQDGRLKRGHVPGK